MGYAGVGPYRFDHVAVDSYCIYTNLPPGGAFRGYGAMQSVWASERVVDMMADQLGIDAVELRRQNLLREGDTFCTGEVMHDVHFEELLDDAAAAVDWKRDGDRAGKGVAIMLKGMQTPSRAEARIELLPDGRYEVQAATADMGQGGQRDADPPRRREPQVRRRTRSWSASPTPTGCPTTPAPPRAAPPT